jgi:hypothetical protein
VSDLEEGMLVSKAFLTVGAKVEIFADRALVTDSNDRRDLTAIARYLLMNYWGFVGDLFGLFFIWKTFNDWSLQDLFEDFL